jgi:hypothetical protein
LIFYLLKKSNNIYHSVYFNYFSFSEVNAGAARGILINKNTIETFRNCDKDKLLQEHGQMLEQAVASGEALENPSLVVGRFILLTFAVSARIRSLYYCGKQ